MPKVIINDEVYEAKVGERLLNVARRHAAHIGFVCDGNGICQTCGCRVLAGSQHLSPPSQAEQTWISDARLAEGNRLACQAVIRGDGPVKVLTAVEELRRQVKDVVEHRGDDDEAPLRDKLEPLLENVVRASVDQIARYPFNMLATLARVGPLRFLAPIRRTDRWVNDASRVAARMSGATPPPRIGGPTADADHDDGAPAEERAGARRQAAAD